LAYFFSKIREDVAVSHLGKEETRSSPLIKSTNSEIELLEANPDHRKSPNLSQRLALHKSAADVASQQALVQIRVDGDTIQQRVTDVLNALAGAKITEITFTDLLDPGAT